MSDHLPDTDHIPEPPRLSRREQFLMDRFHDQIAVEQDAERVLALFSNEKIVTVELRLRRLFDDTHKLMSWGDWTRAEQRLDMIDGALTELRTSARELGMYFTDRWF